MSLATNISPRFLKRLISALLLGPIALLLMVASKPTFLLVWFPALLLVIYEWIGFVRGARSGKIVTALIGMIYIPMTFGSMLALWFIDIANQWWIILIIILAVWASDTGAYVVGKAIGGPKMVPRISPNKTWAGLAGAMLFPAVLLLILGYLFIASHESYFIIYGMFMWGLALGIVCQIGDLFISIFKRRANLKDTGNLIPGHGGILDRIDSLMLASVFSLVTIIVLLNMFLPTI